MSEKMMHFVTGLPQSGSTLVCSILNQNPQIHSNAVSSLSSLIKLNHASWYGLKENRECRNDHVKANVLRSIVRGYYDHVDAPVVLDKNIDWINQIPILEELLQRKVKMVVCVRNPAEILATFEKERAGNPLFVTDADAVLGERSNVVSRAYYYAGPDGILGKAHRHIRDAVSAEYSDRLLFVDYNRFCNTPRAQTKRIYDFLGLDPYEHDYENIEQPILYDELVSQMPNAHKVQSELVKDTINPVAYLGLELFEQYNREIFWDAWI